MGKRAIQTQEDMKEAKRKKKQQERESLRIENVGIGMDDLAPTPRSAGLAGFAPGSLGYRVVYALVRGWEDKDALAAHLGTTRKFVASVEKRLRREGWTRETVTRYRPPPHLIDGFRHQRLTANSPEEEDVPF